MNVRIREKVIGMMILLIIIPILALGLSSYSTSNKTNKTSKKHYTELGTVIGEQARVIVESKINETNELLEDVASNPSIINIAEDDNKNEAIAGFRRVSDNHGFMDVYYGTVDGTLYSGIQDPSINVTERPWYIKANESDSVVWSELYKDATTGKNVVTASKSVYSGDKLIGVAAIDIDLDNFAQAINKVDIMGGSPMVMDKDGTLLVDNRGDVGKTFQGKSMFKEDRKNIQLKEYTYKDEASDFVQEQLIVFAPIDGSDWYVATVIGMDDLVKTNASIIRNILVVSVITIIAGILIAIFFAKHISNSITQVLMAIRKMEEGDFTTRITTKNSDEFGEVRESFNKMMETLCAFIGNIKNASNSVDEYSENLAAISEEVSASSLEISGTAEEIAKGASNQAEDTDEEVALIGRLSDKLLELGATSMEMVGLAEEIRITSKDSTIVVDDLREKTALNNESSKRVEDEIIELDRRIGEVTGILSTIDAISEQTNLLALNASIEAARAGELGKGFAVVAEEIRKLAGESKESSNNIKSIIEAVQLESKNTVEVVGEVNSRNEEQTEAVIRVNESFGTINNLIEQIVSKISEIDSQSTEMNKERNEIVSSIENISAISQETAAASEEVTASIEQQTSAIEEVANSASKLNELANELNREMSMFKV